MRSNRILNAFTGGVAASLLLGSPAWLLARGDGPFVPGCSLIPFEDIKSEGLNIDKIWDIDGHGTRQAEGSEKCQEQPLRRHDFPGDCYLLDLSEAAGGRPGQDP